MEKMKRVLALLLVCAMLMPNLTTIASAYDGEEPSLISTEPVETVAETQAPTEETQAPTEAPTAPVEETEAPTEQTEPAVIEEVPETTAATEAAVEPSADQTEPITATGTVTVQQEVVADQEAVTVTAETSVTVVPDVGEDFVNDDLFRAYVEDQFLDNLPATFGTGGRDRLTSDVQRHTYDVLKTQIQAIAAGEEHSAVISVYDAESAAPKFSWTKEELGLETLLSGNSISQAAQNKTQEKIFAEIQQIMLALLADCPYDLYWYDKLTGISASFEMHTSEEATEISVPELDIYMAVATKYRGDNQYTTTTDLARVKTAAANAAQIVENHKQDSDLDKLTAYKDTICDLVEYDLPAAENNTFLTDSNPWQLIYVFDGEPETKVVCEGYAKAFQYLCDMSQFEADVVCYNVIGFARGPHMWNIVSIDGRNYLVDVTNSDAEDGGVAFGEDDLLFLAGTSGSIAEGYTFTNSKFSDPDLTYAYTYDVTYTDGTTGTIRYALDLFGKDEDSILNLSFLNYQDYLDISAGQKYRLDTGDISGDLWIVDDAELRGLGSVSGLNLTVSGATLVLKGYTKLQNSSIRLEDGARLRVEGELHLDNSALEMADDTYLQIDGGADNRGGTIYVRGEDSALSIANDANVLIPNGALCVDFYEVERNAPNVAPEKLTVQTWVMDQQSLNDSLGDMTSNLGKYHRYEIIADRSFSLEKDTIIPAPLAFEVRNWGDWNDPVVLTVPEGVTLNIGGSYMGIYEGSRLDVEGTVMDGGYLRTHADSSVKITGNGILDLTEGTVDNQGVIYAPSADHLVYPENADWDYWQNNDPIFASTEVNHFLTVRWLDNNENGWVEDSENNTSKEIHLPPGQQYYMIAYLNQWNADKLVWEETPIHASKLVADDKLILEPIERITDGDNRVEDGENMGCFFRLQPAEGVADGTASIAYSNTGIQMDVHLGRQAGGFYSANPAAVQDKDSLWINEYRFEDSHSFWFYYDAARDYENGWSVSNVSATTDRQSAEVTLTNAGTNLWKITLSEDTVKNMYSIGDFWVNLKYALNKDGEPSRSENVNINCRTVDFGRPNATFEINGERYHGSWNYDGLFQSVREGDREYFVPAEIPGVSYDIERNRLTLDNAHLSSLYIDHHWYNEETGEEGWNQPDSRVNLLLIGENTIHTTNEHALMLTNNVHLTIQGEGSLDISMTGAGNNESHSALEVRDSELILDGNVKVTVSVSGVGYYKERPINMTAVCGHGNDRWLRLRGSASLTTQVPAGACGNGYFDADGTFVESGYTGLEFPNIEINNDAVLNTQTIRVWDEGRNNAYGTYRQNGGTVNIAGLPYYNKNNQNENGTVGHWHYSGIEADYGLVEINGGELNISMSATEAQIAKSVYSHAIQSRGRRIDLNGGTINISGNFPGTGIKVGEEDWDGGTNAWVNHNGTELNVKGIGCAIDLVPSGSYYFNGGRINANKADIRLRGAAEWNGTELNATESNFLVVEGGCVNINGGRRTISQGQLVVDNRYDQQGNLQSKSTLTVRGGETILDNSRVIVRGDLVMENGALLMDLNYDEMKNPGGGFATALTIWDPGQMIIQKEAYLEISGKGRVDGISNGGVFLQTGGTVAVHVDETMVDVENQLITAAFAGAGKTIFEGGYAYLEGYYGLFQLNNADLNSQLFVGGTATMDVIGRGMGILTFAPAVFDGGSVHAHASESVLGNEHPVAVLVKNDDGGTNASLTIRGGSHYFEVFKDEKTLAENGRGLWIENASVLFQGGELDVEAQAAVQVVGENATITAPVILSNETGAVLKLTHSETLGAKTLLVGDQFARSVAFRTSRNCGENVTWALEDGVLTISGTGAMDDYHMPANDPESWRVAPWYAMRDVITEVVVEKGVTGIGYWAFGRLPEVTEITYPASVTKLHLESNYDCPKLEKIIIAEENEKYYVTDDGKVIVEKGEDGDTVIAAVRQIESYTAGADIAAIGMGAFDSTNIAKLDLNKSKITEIGNNAFSDCKNLKEVVLPEGLTTIGLSAFQNSGLEHIAIPASVTKIRNYAFDGCDGLWAAVFQGSEAAWKQIAIGTGNNALLRVPMTFQAAAEEEAGDPYLSYRLLNYGDEGYYEDMGEELRKEIHLPVGYYHSMVVYLNVWNPNENLWERWAVDPEQLYSNTPYLEIGAFRNYEGVSIEEGEPNGYNFFEMTTHSGWGQQQYLCYDLENGVTVKLPISVSRFNVGFYSEDPTGLAEVPGARDELWLNACFINPNVPGPRSVYFALTEYDGDFDSVQVGSWKTDEALAAPTVEKISGSVYKITLSEALAKQIYDLRGVLLPITYQIGDKTETVEFLFRSVSLGGICASFGINGIWYEYYEGVEGYFSWDEKTQTHLNYPQLPAGMSYDYKKDILTMKNSTIESLQVYFYHQDEYSGDVYYGAQDEQLTLELIGTNKIINSGGNPNAHAALAVGDGLTLTITGDGSLDIQATNEKATANNFSQNAVNVYGEGASLVIAGNAKVTTYIGTNDAMTNGWLMNLWGNGCNTLTIKDYATLTTTLPAGARDSYDQDPEAGFRGGFRGIDWFGEIRVQDDGQLNTSTLGLSEYYDDRNEYRGSGSFVQTGGITTIEAFGQKNEEGRYNYNGLIIHDNTWADISGGELIVKAKEDYVKADAPQEEGTTYAWFCGIMANGDLNISGEKTHVEIQIPADGTGLETVHSDVTVADEATVKVVGNGCDNYALNASWQSKVWLNGGCIEVIDAKVRVENSAKLEINNNGDLYVFADKYPHQTYLKTHEHSEFVLNDGSVIVDNGMTEDTPDAVSVGGRMHLNGGIMSVSGTNALGVHENAELNQNGSELIVTGYVTVLTVGEDGAIYLNGGETETILGKPEEETRDERTGDTDSGEIDLGGTGDGGDIDLGGGMSGNVINAWSSAMNVYEGGYLEVNGGDHIFSVVAVPGEGFSLKALDVDGTVNFNGGTVLLDGGATGDSIFNRTLEENSTVGFGKDMGAVSAESGICLDMYHRGENPDNGENYFSLGTEETHVSAARITRTSAGSNSSWRIKKNGDKTTLIISGSKYMHDYYMPDHDSDWDQTPWYDYKDQITHVEVESGINSIGDWVFAHMGNLVNVKLPDTLNHISTSAFYDCDQLQSFTMKGNDNYFLDEAVSTAPDAEGYRTGTVIIEGNWKVLKAAPSITEYTVPQHITEIGNGAFQNCTNLTKLTFAVDSSTWNIGNNAFENTGLTEIVLPEGVQAIGRHAFDSCNNVEKICLPNTVNAIRPYAFSGCGNGATTVTFAGSESQWNRISIGTGNGALDKVTFRGEAEEAGDPYLSFRWLDMRDDNWVESQHETDRSPTMAAGARYYGVFYYNQWDGGKWTAKTVIPEATDNSVSIEKIEDLLEEYGWQIAPEEKNAENFVMLTIAPNSWEVDGVDRGVITYQDVEMDITIQRNQFGFYSAPEATDANWLNDYEMNPLKQNNEFYFIFEDSEHWKLVPGTIRIGNHNGAPDTAARLYQYAEGVYRIALDPIFLQDAWKYGNGMQIWVGFDVEKPNGEERHYEQGDFQLKPLDLGSPDAIIGINDMDYLYFADGNGWMTHGDPANDWRPGVAMVPAGVSYDAATNTLTLNNAKLNNLELNYNVHDGEGNPTGETKLPKDKLTLNLIGSNVIESGHRGALRIDGDLKVTITGEGTLRMHSHNSTDNYREDGQPYAFDTVAVENRSTLTIAGGTVVAEISGESYWREGEKAMPAALSGRFGSNLVISGGSLTTKVPENARDNGPDEVDFEDYYGARAISEFSSITVTGGKLETTSLYVNSGASYKQTGGDVNITGLGHISWQWNEHGDQYRNYHYNGLHLNQGAKAEISGGNLVLNVMPEPWENGSGSHFSGLSIAGGEAVISRNARIHVAGAAEGSAITVHSDYNEHGQPVGSGKLTITGGKLTLDNPAANSYMNGLSVEAGSSATITGGELDLMLTQGYGGINNMGELTIGGNTKIKLNGAVESGGDLTVTGGTSVDVTHVEGQNMYAWDIYPGSNFNFESGTITGKHAAFMIGGDMTIGKNAALKLEDSDFNADGMITLDGGSLTMSQEALVDNVFLGQKEDEWGNVWDEYEYQSRLYVTGLLDLNSGSVILNNVSLNVGGNAVMNQNGAAVSMVGTAVKYADREGGDEHNDWLALVNVEEDAVLNINGGSFRVNAEDFDGGLNVRGTLNLRNGVLDVDVPVGIAIAARGQNLVSGGEMNLSGQIGYQQFYEKGFENGKLTVTGGKIRVEAENTGFELYNDMVVTGGDINIDISGYTQTFTDEQGNPVTMLGGRGILGYHDTEKLNVSINGGTLSINAPVEAPAGCNAVSVFGILGGRNATVRINGGDVSIKARTALYAESQENAKHIVINNRLQVLSLETGNTLNVSSGIVEFTREDKDFTWYVDTYEEDEIWTTPYNNNMMADYATNLRIVRKSAGTNTFWSMKDGTLTITSPSTGTMTAEADWNLVADKVTRLVVEPNVTQPDDLTADRFPYLKSVKTAHDTVAEDFAGVTVEYFHDMVKGADGIEKCSVCDYTSVQSKVEDLVAQDDVDAADKVDAIKELTKDNKEALKNDLEDSSSTVVENIQKLEQQLKEETNTKVTVDVKEDTHNDLLDKAEEVEIVGAALNADQNISEVKLVIENAPEDMVVSKDYEQESAVLFSMTLEGVADASKLEIPVKITLPVPAGIDPAKMVILHYHGGAVSQLNYTLSADGKTVTFVLDGFSEFAMVQKTPVKVEIQNQQIKLGDNLPEFTAAFTPADVSGITLDYKVIANQKAVDSIKEAGEYTITATATGPENYDITVVDGKLTVVQQNVEVAIQDATIALGETPKFDFTVPDGVKKDAIRLTYQINGNTVAAPTAPGVYTVTATVQAPDYYPNVQVKSATLTVVQSVAVTVQDAEMKVDGSLDNLFSADTNIALNYWIEDAQGNKVETPTAGIYTIRAEAMDPYYKVNVTPGKLTVVQDIVVTIQDAEVQRFENPPEFTFVVSGGDQDLITLVYDIDDVDLTKAGTYPVTAVAEAPEYYNVTVVPGTLTVVQNVEVILKNVTVSSGKTPEFGFVVDTQDVDASQIQLKYWIEDANGNSLDNYTAGGYYTINAEADKVPDYYEVTVKKTGTLTVIQDVTVTIGDIRINQGEPLPTTFQYTVSDGVDADQVKLTFAVVDENGNPVTDTNTIGEYRITAEPVEGENPFYNITVEEGVLKIAEPIVKFNFAAANVLMGNDLDMKFAFPKKAMSDWAGCYVVIERSYSMDKNGNTKDNHIVTVPYENWDTSGSYYVVVYEGLAAKEMSDQIVLTVYNADGVAISNPWVDSLCEYGTRQVRNVTNELQRTMFVDMLNYGAAAQTNFKYGTDKLANRLLTEKELGYGSVAKDFSSSLNRGDKWAGSNIVLESNISFWVAFKGLNTDMYATVEFTNHYNNPMKISVSGNEFGKSGSYYYIDINALVIADARQPITITIYNADGTVYTVCHESIEDYLARRSSVSEMFAAIMKFADSAHAYLHRNDK